MGFLARPVYNNMRHVSQNKNIGLCFIRNEQGINKYNHIFISNKIVDLHLFSPVSGCILSPLYLYPEVTSQQNLLETNERTPNLNPEIVKQIAGKLGLTFVAEKEGFSPPKSFAPIDLLDYIYAVLHSPTYREKYKEFLKIDFPRVPYPTDIQTFWKLVALGGELREIHLLECPTVEKYITQYPEDGDNVVKKPSFVKSPISNSPTPISSENSPFPVSSENSPPLEGCPTGGVVPTTFIKNIPIFFNPILELPYNIKLKTRAKELRQAENLSEVLFWMQVTKNQFYKIDFDRQRIIGNYIVDFYVKNLGLVIEIDGPSHDTKEEYDKVREEYLVSLGLKVYRIPVIEVLQNMKTVMRNLEDYIIENYGEPSGNSTEDKEPPRPLGTPPEEGNLKGNLGRVYINEKQYFDNVPEVAWNFYIGGYQPAQKWLKDRKERELSYEDILHYQKIIVALSETDRIMNAIDTIEI